MPLFKSAPPPQPVQQATDQRGMFTPTWADWFFRLREKLEQVTILPTLGTANQLLSVNAGATDLEYKTLSGTANQITVGYSAGTAVLSFLGPHNFTTQTLNGILYGNGTSAIAATAALTDGQLLVGQTSAAPSPKTITGDWTLSAAGAATLANVNSNVGSFGSSTNVPQITVNAKGLITAASNVAIAFPVTSVFGQTGAVADLSGDVTTSGSSVTTLATVNSNIGTFGDSANIPQITVNAKGLVTAVSNVSVGGGTVTSVALSATPSGIFDVSGSPVTGSGTLTLALDNQSANQVLSGPVSGSATTPAFRALVTADMPAIGAYYCIGNTSKNNSGTPTTQFDLTAERVVLMNSSGQAVVRLSPGTITNNTSTAGSTANGRDQSGAFSASSWVHFYWIWDGTTLASLSSASATAPTLPTNYTHWAYCCAVRFNGSSQMPNVRCRGAWVYYEARVVALSSGAATAETSVDVSAIIPPNALQFHVEAIQTATTDGAGAFNVNSLFRFVSGVNFWASTIQLNGLGITSTEILSPAVLITPNNGQAFLYLNTNVTGSVTFTVVIGGYSVPNGGE